MFLSTQQPLYKYVGRIGLVLGLSSLFCIITEFLIIENPMEKGSKSQLTNLNAKKGSHSLHQWAKRKPKQNSDHKSHASIIANKIHTNSVAVVLCYSQKKLQITLPAGIPLSQLSDRLYKEIYRAEKHRLTKQQLKQHLESVLGFYSLDSNLNFDYRLSIGKGTLNNNKILGVFQRSTSAISPGKKINYKIYKCLAIGGFSKVYLGRSYDDGKFYAMKFIQKKQNMSESNKEQNRKTLENEINIGKQLNHPFLVKLYHAFETRNFYCLISQYCPGGELFFLLKKVRNMAEEEARFYFIQILYAIQYLHSKNIIYRDLKPQNILVDADGNLKIADFGLSKVIGDRGKTFSYCGSAQYMAPEMILRSGHSFAVDYYSLGALLYELVTGLPPFYTKDPVSLQQSIICQYLSFPSLFNISTQIKDLLYRLLSKQQKTRLGSYIGIKEILFHPWVGKIKSTDILDKKVECPFPTNLDVINFDQDELGDDETQFTQNVYQELNEINFLSRTKIDDTDVQGPTNFFHEFLPKECVTSVSQPLIDKIMNEFVEPQQKLKSIATETQLKKGNKTSSQSMFSRKTHSLQKITKKQHTFYISARGSSSQSNIAKGRTQIYLEEEKLRNMKLLPYFTSAVTSTNSTIRKGKQEHTLADKLKEKLKRNNSRHRLLKENCEKSLRKLKKIKERKDPIKEGQARWFFRKQL